MKLAFENKRLTLIARLAINKNKTLFAVLIANSNHLYKLFVVGWPPKAESTSCETALR